MLIAHAPAGYLLTRFLTRTLFKDKVKPRRDNRLYRGFMVAGIIGGICPDFDFIYHIFIDSSSTPHHSYMTHFPMFWIAVWIVLFTIGRLVKNWRVIALSTTFCLSALLHLSLDTLTGVIYWLAPFYHKGVNVFAVADVHVWWVHNYTGHWTFCFEILIVTVAMIQFFRIPDTISNLVDLFRNNKKTRLLSLRLAICGLGMCLVIIFGSIKLNLDNRFVHKVKQLKHYIARMTYIS